MTIFTVHFNYPNPKQRFNELLRVFRDSVHKIMPQAMFVVSKIDPPERTDGRSHTFSSNCAKLYEWVRFMRETEEQEIIFADCDMLALRDASHAFDIPFDVAVTMQVAGKYPMNGGIVFARNTEKAIAFFDLWADVNDWLFNNPREHKAWNTKYAGMNQAAFGYMREKTDMAGADVYEYQTRPWNAVDSDWRDIDEETVFLHIKSALRREVTNYRVPYGKYTKAMRLWYGAAGYEKLAADTSGKQDKRPHRKYRRRHRH